MAYSPGGASGQVLAGEFRAHALEMLIKLPWFAAWDPLALEVYVDCWTYVDKSTGDTKLKAAGIWVVYLSTANHGDETASLNVPCRRL